MKLSIAPSNPKKCILYMNHSNSVVNEGHLVWIQEDLSGEGNIGKLTSFLIPETKPFVWS